MHIKVLLLITGKIIRQQPVKPDQQVKLKSTS